MVTNPANRWAVSSATFLLWGAVAASAVYWGLKLGNSPVAAIAPPPPRAVAQVDTRAVGRLLGANPAVAAAPAPSAASRFNLVGVVANASSSGAALIAVDGKPPKPYRVGAEVDPGLVLQSVSSRSASLGPANGAATVTLELPLRK
jgi:general secretion pathway protein C